MGKSFEERMKENGYTDEMLKMEDAIERAARKGLRVKIIDIDGVAYEGLASSYTKADDEENGFATVWLDTENKEGWIFGVNEIKSIEEIGKI